MDNSEYLTVDDVMDRWHVNRVDLFKRVQRGDVAFELHPRSRSLRYTHYRIGDRNNLKLRDLGEVIFRKSDLERYEETHPHLKSSIVKQAETSAEEKRQLGRLKLEKAKWDESIAAAIAAGVYAANSSKKLTKKQLNEYLLREHKLNLETTTFDRIWKAIPERYRNIGGRPRKD